MLGTASLLHMVHLLWRRVFRYVPLASSSGLVSCLLLSLKRWVTLARLCLVAMELAFASRLRRRVLEQSSTRPLPHALRSQHGALASLKWVLLLPRLVRISAKTQSLVWLHPLLRA
jgi:hypothetical protein